jgi:Dolichyl-phosphate-mannose-protein mannosyltransferase
VTRAYQTRYRLGFLALLGGWAVLATVCIGENAVVIDEYAHVPAGLSHWQLGRFGLYHENPPLVRMLASFPAWVSGAKVDYSRAYEGYRSEWAVGMDFINAKGSEYQRLIARCRIVVLVLAASCGLLIFWWAAQHYGEAVALICTSLWFLDPTVMTNSTMATTDIGTTTFALLATFLFSRYLRRPINRNGVAAGIGLGLALGCKFSNLALIPSWLLLAVLASKSPIEGEGGPDDSGSSPGFWGRFILILGIGILILNCIYGFEGTSRPLGTFHFRSQLLSGIASDGHENPASGNRFSQMILGSLPVPLPYHYLLGFDSQKWDEEQGFVHMDHGRLVHRGTWTSPLATLFYKTPIGTISLVVFSMLYWLARSRRVKITEAIFAVPAITFLSVIASQTGLNWAVRYSLPALPFLILATGRSIKSALETRFGKPVIIALVAWNCYEFWSIHPLYHSYGNEFIGGAEGAGQHFIGSNFDWGQDLLRLKRWSDEHTECQPLNVTYYGALNPAVLAFRGVGVPLSFLPSATSPDNPGPPVHREPFYWAVSSALLNGLAARVVDETENTSTYIIDNTRLKKENALARIGHSIYIFRIAENEDLSAKTLGYDRLKGCLRLPTSEENKTHASP